jgi:MFS family permease
MTSPSRGLVPGLAVTETVSWGILYYAFPVLLPAMERDPGWSRTTLIGAFTAAVIVSGLAALPVGRLLDHRPARPLMTAGSVLATVAVLGWAAANTVAAFYLAWIAIGAAMALVLYEPAQVVLVKQFGAHATRAITTLTLVAGFASTIFQPLTAILADHLGWRTSLIVLAIALAAVTIPVHLLVLPGRRTDAHARPVIASDTGRGQHDRAVALLTVAFTLAMATMAAGIVHLIPYLVDHGWSPVLASIAAGTLGVTQVAARIAFGPTARRTSAASLAAHPRPSRCRHRRPGAVRRRVDGVDRGRPARHRPRDGDAAAPDAPVAPQRTARLRPPRRHQRRHHHHRPGHRPARAGRDRRRRRVRVRIRTVRPGQRRRRPARHPRPLHGCPRR